MIFDNSKVRRFGRGAVGATTFEQGAREIVAWHDEDPARRTVDARLNGVMDALVQRFL